MIDQIILSTNENPMYIDYWKPVAWAYKKIFPNVKVHLAFLTNRSEDDELVKEFRKFGDVTLFPIIDDIQQFSQAKMIRFILASMQGDDVCYIDDIDLLPLSKTFITDKTDKRPKNHLLCVGGEVYRGGGREQRGTYPVSQMTAEGHVWKQFINPEDLEWPELMAWFDTPILFSDKENIHQTPTPTWSTYFSDERLLRKLLHNHPVPKFEMERGYEATMEGILGATVDRMTWEIDEEKLFNHEYQNAHGPRPYDPADYKLLIDYLEKTYP